MTMPPASAGELSMEQTAVALQASLRVAQLLGLETGEVSASLTSAAMAAARGAKVEAQKTLQEAYDKLEPETAQKFEAMAQALEEQEGRLREEGIAADVAREVSRSRRAFDEGARIEAVESLQKASKEMGELESAWKTVKETLLRIDTLRDVGKRLGMDLSKVDERLAEVRKTLSEENLTATALTDAGTQGGAALVLLHEQVRNQIALLGQEAIRSLKAHPPAPAQREKAESRLKQVLAHARAGRLKEASEEMVSFRQTFLGIAPEPVPAAEPVSPSVEPAVATDVPTGAAAAPTTVGSAPAASSPPTPVGSTPTASPEVRPPAETAPPSTPPEAKPEVRSEPKAEPTPEPQPKAEVAPESRREEKPGPTAGKVRPVGEIVADARALGAKMKERQKAKKDVSKAAGLLKEVTGLIKAGKLGEADGKLTALREALDEA